MSRATIVVEAGKHSAWLSGSLGPIHLAITKTGTPWMRCRLRGIPSIPLTHADDVMVYLEAVLGRRIDYRQVDR